MKTAYLTANYIEPLADKTFKGLNLSVRENGNVIKELKFNTGDPIVDFFDYKSWIMNNCEKEGIVVVTSSSSIDHFYMDSKKYHERVVIFNKDFTDGQIVDWRLAEKKGHDIDKLVTCCVTDNMKTWQELKQYVKSK